MPHLGRVWCWRRPCSGLSHVGLWLLRVRALRLPQRRQPCAACGQCRWNASWRMEPVCGKGCRPRASRCPASTGQAATTGLSSNQPRRRVQSLDFTPGVPASAAAQARPGVPSRVPPDQQGRTRSTSVESAPALGMLGKSLKLLCREPILLGLALRMGDAALDGDAGLKLPGEPPKRVPGAVPPASAVRASAACSPPPSCWTGSRAQSQAWPQGLPPALASRA